VRIRAPGVGGTVQDRVELRADGGAGGGGLSGAPFVILSRDICRIISHSRGFSRASRSVSRFCFSRAGSGFGAGFSPHYRTGLSKSIRVAHPHRTLCAPPAGRRRRRRYLFRHSGGAGGRLSCAFNQRFFSTKDFDKGSLLRNEDEPRTMQYPVRCSPLPPTHGVCSTVLH